VSISNTSPQQDSNFDDSQLGQMLLSHKTMLLGMNKAIKPPANLRLIEINYVNWLIGTLNQMIVELESIMSNANARTYVRNLGTVHNNIRNFALTELYAALDKLDEGYTQDYYRGLLNCSDYLEVALNEFLI
jgi:hypothetical protein